METILEILLQFVMIIPGAFIRWVVFGFRKQFNYYLEADGYLNGSIGILFLVFTIMTCKILL